MLPSMESPLQYVGVSAASSRLVRNSSTVISRMLLVDMIFALIDNGLGIDWDQRSSVRDSAIKDRCLAYCGVKGTWR
jgi:hypothetical protein